MSIFKKLKDNITRGGISLQIEAPATLNLADKVVSLTVHLNAKSEQTVKSIKVQLVEVSEERSLGYSDDDSTERNEKVIAEMLTNQQFKLSSDETKTVSLSLPVPSNSALETNESMRDRAKSAFNKISKALDTNEYSYHFKVVADVEGVAMDPSCKKDVTVIQEK